MTAAQPLDGTLVIDFTQAIAGPLATRVLADLGARVIKVESPRGDLVRETQWPGPGRWSPMFGHGSGGKESVAVDLRSPAGHALIDRLLNRADVIAENFRPGTMKRLGFDPTDLVERPRRPVVCSVSGFGQGAGQADWSATDPVGQAVSGMTHMIGEPGGRPYLAANGVADSATAMCAAAAVLAALYARERTGCGRWIDLAMADAMVGMDCVNNPPAAMDSGARRVEPLGHDHPAVCPFGVFAATDGHVVIQGMGAGPDSTWGRLCAAIDRRELLDDERSATEAGRLANRDFVNTAISGWTATRGRDEVVDGLRAHSALVGAVLRPDEVVRFGLFRERGMLGAVPAGDETVEMVGTPLATSGLAGPPRRPPRHGEHTRPVLEQELELAPERVDELLAQGVVCERSEWP